MKTEIISFFSDIDGHTYYSDHARRLASNCKKLNMPCEIRQLQSQGSYRLNCLSKPKFIRNMLREKQKPLIWLDVDSVVHNELKIFDDKDELCDMMFAYSTITPKLVDPLKPKASPIYLTPKQIVFDFLDYWVDRCMYNMERTDVKVFDHEVLLVEVLPQFIKQLKIGILPMNYALWPTDTVPEGMTPYITIGVANNSSKEKSLREMGLPERDIQFNLLKV
jgi:hypothetical protein